MDRLVGPFHGRARAEGLSRIRVTVELREVAARDIDPDAMPWLKSDARAHQVDFELIDFAWFE